MSQLHLADSLVSGGVVLDWCQGTLPYESGQEDVIRLFGPIDWMGRGVRGYSEAGTLPCGALVAYHPKRKDQRFLFSFPGAALALCSRQCGYVGDSSAISFLADLVSSGARFTRLDFAIDDFSGLLNMDEIYGKIERGHFVSRWKKVSGVQALRGSEGRTFYFGSRQSFSMLRIYDKRAEQLDKGQECDFEHWIRVELELHKDVAQQLGSEVVSSQSVSPVLAFLRYQLEFKCPAGADVAVWRWPCVDWWLSVVGLDKAPCVLPSRVKTIEEAKAWFELATAPTLSVIQKYMGPSFDAWLRGVVAGGELRERVKHKLMLRGSRV